MSLGAEDRGRLARAFFLSVVAACLTFSPAALAEPTRVVLVRPSRAGPLIEETLTRAQAELRAAGFATLVVDAQPGEPPRDTFRRADPTAVAGIALQAGATRPAAEVWVEDRLAGTLSTRASQGPGDPHGAAADLAIQAVELLRASLVELDAARHAPPEDGAKPPPKARAAPPTAEVGHEPEVGGPALGFGAAFLVGLDPATILVAPVASAAWVADVGLGGRLRWAGPSAGPDLTAEEGAVAWTTWTLTAGAIYEAIVAERLLLRASADAGMIHVHAEGDLESPARSRGGSALDAVFLAGGAAGVFLTPALSLTAGAEILVTAPPPVVQVGGRDVATVGRPWLFFPLALELRPW